MSARNSVRPDSRASTTSATSQRHDARSSAVQDAKPVPVQYMAHNPEQALLNYQASISSHPLQQYESAPQIPQQNIGHHHTNSGQFPLPGQYGAQESPYMSQDMSYTGNVRVGSVPMAASLDIHDDKRRKGSAVTATNDKELREMLAKNERRPLREVAQEVIQKERTPMAEKTKQLFAMLWYVPAYARGKYVANNHQASRSL